MRIMIAGARALERECIAGLLRACGYEVVAEVADGQAAVQQAEQMRPDVVLVDVQLPEMDGLEVGRVLRARYPSLKVVLLDEQENRRNRHQATQCGIDAYIPKNVTKTKLFEALGSPGEYSHVD